MSLTFRSSHVSRPSTAPTSSGGSGSLTIAHRRVNKLGQRSAPSPLLESTSLPATLTPQTYSDNDGILRDEFIVSNDSGATWRIIPTATDHIGALVVPSAFDPSWPTTSTASNQATTDFNLDFGEFNSSNEPSQILYLVNVGTSVNSLTFNFVDLVTQTPLVQLAGKIQVEILGTYSALGNLPDNSFNSSLIWDLPQVSLNTFSLVLPQFSFLKIRLTLLNYPIGNLSQEVFNLSLSVVANQTSFPLTYPNQWPEGTFLIDEDSPYDLPIVEGINSTTFQVNPFMFNQGGILRTQLRTLVLDVVNGNRILSYSPTGQIVNWASTDTIPSDHQVIATLTFTAGIISNLVYPWPIKPQSYLKVGTSSTQPRARFIRLNSDQTLALATTLQDAFGISLAANENLVATSGLAWLEVGEAVTVGSRLVPGASGRGFISTTGGIVVALEGGSTNQIIKVGFLSVPTSSGGGGTWGSITGTLSAQTDLQTALDGKQNLQANLTTISGWTADQTTRAGGIPAATSGTLEKTGANTLGTYTVTAFAKTILDDADQAAVRTTLGLGSLATLSSVGDAQITGVAWGKLSAIPANLTTISGWTSDQVSRAGGIPAATSGAIEKTGTNTYGTFPVTAAAKTVLDDSSVADMRTTLGAAPLASPALTGTPTAPTASSGTNTTQIATTAFVESRSLSRVFGEYALNNYAASMTTGVVLEPTLVTPTVYAGSGFATSGFTVPAGQGGLYFVEVYGEIVGSGYNLQYATVGFKRNSTNFFRRNQINFNVDHPSLAYINSLGSMVFLNAGDTIRPQFETSFLSGTAQLLNASFLVHRMTSN